MSKISGQFLISGQFQDICDISGISGQLGALEYEVDGARPRGRPKKTWRVSVEKDCQARGLNREDAMDHSRWMKQIRDD